MPPSLRLLGNARVWNAIRSHLVATPHAPFVLAGPTGCGKTVGITALLEAMRLTPVTIDAVEADDTHQMVTWIKRTRDSNSFEGRRAVVVDDMEGFTDKARDALVALSKDDAHGRAPLVLVVHNARDPVWKRLQGLPTFRMFPPKAHVATEWFAHHHVWTTMDADGNATRRKGFSYALLDDASSVLASGDLRRAALHLAFAATTGRGLQDGHDAFPSNIFEATRRLYKRTLPPDDWATFAEPRDVHLLQYHSLEAVGDDLEAVAQALDTFSVMDARRPSRYEHVHAYDHCNAHVVAASTRRFTNPARDVGALCPPPRPTRPKPPPDTETPVDALNRCGWR